MSSIFRSLSQEEIAGLLKHKHPEGGKLVEGLDKAIVGVTGDGRLVYSENRILLALQEEMGHDFEDALVEYESMSTGTAFSSRRPPVIIVHES
jgi:hypothetical protein